MKDKISKIINEYTHWLAAAILIIVGTLLVFAVPPLWGFDEGSHFARVYQMARGDIIPNRTVGSEFGGKMPVSYNQLVFYSMADIGEDKTPYIFDRKDVNNAQGYDQFTRQKFSEEEAQAINPASYFFMAYPMSVIAVAIAQTLDLSIGTTLLLSRIASLLTYAAIVAFTIWILKKYKIKWLFFIIALLPVMVFQASVLSADTIVNALALLFVAIIYRLLSAKNEKYSRHLTMLALVIAVTMPLSKLNYLFLSFGILLIPGRYLFSKKWSVSIKVATCLIATLGVVVWGALSKVTSNAPSVRPDGAVVSASDQIEFLIAHPFHFIVITLRSLVTYGDGYLREATAVLGWNYVQVPFTVTIIILVLTFIVAIWVKDEVRKFKREWLILGILIFVGAMSIFASLYAGFTPTARPVVEGVQGRYFLPFVIPIIMLLSAYIPFSLRSGPRTIPYVSFCVTLTMLVSSVIYYLLATY